MKNGHEFFRSGGDKRVLLKISLHDPETCFYLPSAFTNLEGISSENLQINPYIRHKNPSYLASFAIFSSSR